LAQLKDHKIFVKRTSIDFVVFYSFEMQMAGVILLTAMAAGGVSLWLKRRKAQKELDEAQNDEPQNF
jgi:hypothetical protein